MEVWVIGIRVSITNHVSDEPQPGIIQCEFVDAHDHRWTFTEKTQIVSSEYLTGETVYPRPGLLLCKIIGPALDCTEQDVIEVASEYFPDGMESDEPTIRFAVSASSLVELGWYTGVQSPWSGII